MIPVHHIAGTFILLMFGHCLADYPLQGEFLSRGKNRHSSPYLAWMPWQCCLLAHAMIHAGFVYIFTGSIVCCLGELVAHTVTDYVKCEGWINATLDQVSHIWCKVVFVAYLIWAAMLGSFN